VLAGGFLGTAAISLFSINTWYALAIPLCSLGAILVLNAAKGPTAAALRWVVLVLLASAVVAGYFVAGWLGAVIFGAVLMIAVVLMLTRAEIP
jgi:hypothetical protein